jgi:hypothetical protein
MVEPEKLRPWSQVPHLEAEYAYAVRHLDFQTPKKHWSPYLLVAEWCEVLGTENRNGASRQLKNWCEARKAEQRIQQGSQQPRGWRVLLSELSTQQQERVLARERERMERAMKKKPMVLSKKPSCPDSPELEKCRSLLRQSGPVIQPTR